MPSPESPSRFDNAQKVKILLKNDFAMFSPGFYIVCIFVNFYFLRADDKKSRNAKKMLKSVCF